MLEARQLAAVRGNSTVFGGLDIRVTAGRLLHVKGANGSGKTTLLRTLCGLILPHEGKVLWNGQDIRLLREEYWKFLAYVGHADGLKDDLTAEENLAFACALSGLQVSAERARAALEKLGLARRERLPARALSQGQRRRAALARLAVAESQPLWILDEPFAALDTAAVEQIQSLVSAHLARGGMVVLTTHQDARIESQSAVDLRLGQ